MYSVYSSIYSDLTNMTTSYILPTRLTFIEQGYCNICRKNKGTSYFCFFEGNIHNGWQYCKTCQKHIPSIVQNAKKHQKNVMTQDNRCPIYIELKPDIAIDNSKLDKYNITSVSHNNNNNEYIIKLNTIDHSNKIELNDFEIINPATVEREFRINSSSFRLSASLDILIWDDIYGVYETLSNLIQLNSNVFGQCFDDSIFQIDFDIEDLNDKKELTCLIDKFY